VKHGRKKWIMKSREELHQKLRRRILSLSDVTERQNAGIHDDAFFVGEKMFMHIHGHGHCDIQLAKDDQERVLAEGKARQHRWAPEAGYVTVIVHREEDLEPAMDLIRMSHRYFADRRNLSRMQHH
jgi:Luciferase